MSDVGLMWAATVLILALATTLIVRTVAAERAAGEGGGQAEPFHRPLLVRRLDRVGVLLAVIVVAVGVLRVFLGTIG